MAGQVDATSFVLVQWRGGRFLRLNRPSAAFQMAKSAHHESEYQTRRERIDPKLEAHGSKIVPFDPDASLSSYTRHAITEFPTKVGPADYALCVDGRPLGLVQSVLRAACSVKLTEDWRRNANRATPRRASTWGAGTAWIGDKGGMRGRP